METLFCCVCCCYYCCLSEPPKKKLRFEFGLLFQNILFTRNEAFLPGSSHVIYAKKKKGLKVYNKIKTSSQNFLTDDPAHLQINDCMKIKATLKQTLADKYLERYQPKQMKLKIRQKTKISSLNSHSRYIGYIVLDLHTLASSASDQEYDFPLVDPKGKCEAVVRIRVMHSFVQHKKWCDWMALTCHRKRKRELTTSRLAVNQTMFDELVRMKSSSGSSSLRFEPVSERTALPCQPSGDNKENIDILKENGSQRSTAMTIVSSPQDSSSTCGVRLEGGPSIMIVSECVL
eukprot:scaffold504_cov189-Ochromonas_danica.AAC.11